MPRTPKPVDIAVLQSLVDYVALSSSQLSELHGKKPRTMRHVLQALCEAGLAEATTEIVRGRGHPERVMAISAHGYAFLAKEVGLPQERPAGPPRATSLQCIEHLLLENWAQIRLQQLERGLPQLSVRFLSSRSGALCIARDGQPLQAVSIGGEQRPLSFDLVPDGVFAITHRAQQRTLLFFVEVDMGTESIESRSPDHPCIHRKIEQYTRCFSSRAYRRYEQAFCSALNGFRVLFITSTTSRLHALCRSIVRWEHTDFVWLTDESSLLAHGIGEPIWVRGGQIGRPLDSILGGALPKAFRRSGAASKEAPQQVERAGEEARSPGQGPTGPARSLSAGQTDLTSQGPPAGVEQSTDSPLRARQEPHSPS